MSLQSLSAYRCACVEAARYWRPAVMDGSGRINEEKLADLRGDRTELKEICAQTGWDIGLVAESIVDAVRRAEKDLGRVEQAYEDVE